MREARQHTPCPASAPRAACRGRPARPSGLVSARAAPAARPLRRARAGGAVSGARVTQLTSIVMAVSKEASVTLEALLLAVGGVRPLLRLSLEEAGRLAAVSRGMRAAVAGDCVWGKAQEALEADFPHLKPPEGEKLAKVHKKLEPKAETAEDELFFPPLGDELMKMLRDRSLPDHAWRVVVADARDDAEAYAALAPQAKVGALMRYATETKAVLRKCVIDMDWESWELDLDDIDGDDLLGFDVDILQSFCRKRYSLLVKLAYVNIAERGFHEGDGPYYVVDDALSEQAIYGYRYDWMQGSSFRDWYVRSELDRCILSFCAD